MPLSGRPKRVASSRGDSSGSVLGQLNDPLTYCLRDAVRRPRRVTRQTALAGLQELLGPSVIKALGNTLAAAKLGDAGFAAQAVQNDADLFSSAEWRLRVTRRMFFTSRSDADLA